MITVVTLLHADAMTCRDMLASYIAQLQADIDSGEYFKGGKMMQLLTDRLAAATRCHEIITAQLGKPLIV